MHYVSTPSSETLPPNSLNVMYRTALRAMWPTARSTDCYHHWMLFYYSCFSACYLSFFFVFCGFPYANATRRVCFSSLSFLRSLQMRSLSACMCYPSTHVPFHNSGGVSSAQLRAHPFLLRWGRCVCVLFFYFLSGFSVFSGGWRCMVPTTHSTGGSSLSIPVLPLRLPLRLPLWLISIRPHRAPRLVSLRQ